MLDEIEQLGGMREKDIRVLFERLSERLASLERIVCANGRPSLEDRMRADMANEARELRKYVDERDTHKMKSTEQMFLQTGQIVEYRFKSLEEGMDNIKDGLEQNGKDIADGKAKFAWAAGALAVLTAAQPIIFHFWR